MRYSCLLIVLLTSCAVSPQRIASLTDRSLCVKYHESRNNSYLRKDEAGYRAEIERRNLIQPDEWALIDKKEARLGMSVCALRASWGPAKENSITSKYGSSIQHVYRLSWCRRCNVQYVYTENGIVTAIQD
jgi:hypothetical protein